MPKYDFSGWATKANLRCADGKTILRDAFADQDGTEVPLVWNHQHDTPENVLGHALLENRKDGVYAYCTFNDNETGKIARGLVQHGDVTSLSIWANKLKQDVNNNVLHGAIREVSLVLAGANPGANIDYILEHGDMDTETVFTTEEPLTLYHSDDFEDEDEIEEEDKVVEEEPEEEFEDESEDDEKEDNEELENDSDDNSDDELEHSDMTVDDIRAAVDSMNETQRNAMYAVLGSFAEEENNEGDNEMKHNAFEGTIDAPDMTLSHAEQGAIIGEAMKSRLSLRDLVNAKIEDGELKHSVTDDEGNVVTYGIANIDYLFPEAKNYTDTPEFIMRKQDWVTKVMSGVHHTPFSRVKSMFADITMDEARAKGYIKAHQKKEEVFKLLKRKTDPQTVYKLQKLDRDDILDITDFDVVAWLKKEMRIMLDEELARGYLIGDGRTALDEDHIDPDKIRPIWTDDELYTISCVVEVKSTDTLEQRADKIIDAVIAAQAEYEGSGGHVQFFCDRWFPTRAKLIRNKIDEKMYKTKQELADTLDVDEIVSVPVMKNQKRTVDNVERTLVGIIVDLNDYNVGADKGGAVSMFDDFDINFNQEKYLIETRCSGAMVKPHAAIAVEMVFV